MHIALGIGQIELVFLSSESGALVQSHELSPLASPHSETQLTLNSNTFR